MSSASPRRAASKTAGDEGGNDGGGGGGGDKAPSAASPRTKSPPKSRGKSRSKSPPKSAAGLGSKTSAGGSGRKRSSSKGDGGGGTESGTASKAGSATLRRVTLRSASIHERGLKTADMCGQGMTVLNASVFTKKDTGILDLSSNNLRSIPPDIKRLQSLVHLDVSRNGIRCAHNADYGGLPAELSLLPGLEILIISECNLPFVPPAIWKCKKLKVLDISRNKINLLPPDIGQLEELQHLNAQQTNICTLPPEIAYCQALEDILLWGNVIDSLPDTMREMGALKQLAINCRSFTQIVDNYMDNLLRKGQIASEHIPPVLFEIPSLNVLDLDETKINSLPEKCAGNLKEFYLAKNYFQSIAPMILQLACLETLDLSHNLITDLPKNLGDLKNLTVLRLNNNAFIKVPDSIGELSHLEELSMGHNRIQALPLSIGSLTALKVLLLEKNELVSLPDTLVQLVELETLDVTSNQIRTLPSNFHQMKKITTAHSYSHFHKHGLWLHNNPLIVPPETIWKTTDPKSIYLYLKKLEIKRTENLQRQKMVVLGEAQCGKTSLIRSMAAGKSSLTSGLEESTEVVDFIQWKTDNNVDFLIHDIGGDDVYKTTTPLFIDPKAMYVLVYDHRKYTPEKHGSAIGYWLDQLYMYAPGAIIKIVGTQCDQCIPDFVEKTREHVTEQLAAQIRSYEEKMGQEITTIGERLKQAKEMGLKDWEVNSLKKQKFRLMMQKRKPLRIQGDVSLVNCAEGIRGVHQLITDLELIGVDKELFPHCQRFVPSNYAKFRTALKRQQSSGAAYITMVEMQDLARSYNIVKDTFDDCLRFFKDIGEVLWFENVPALKDIVFQRPKALVAILRGLFTHTFPQQLNYAENRVFSSKGYMTAEIFEMAKDHLLTSGEISRDMLLCLWFYLRINVDLLEQLLDLIPRLDLAYTIPQPDVPPRRTEFFPLLIIPFFNRDPPPQDISGIWPEEIPDDIKQVELCLTFPLMYPNGLFERLSCRLQEKLVSRVDWQDLILTEFFSGKMLISRELDPENYDCIIRIRIRGEDLNFHKNTMGFVYRELGNLLASCPGLVWYKKFLTNNCGENVQIADCFPREVLMSD